MATTHDDGVGIHDSTYCAIQLRPLGRHLYCSHSVILGRYNILSFSLSAINLVLLFQLCELFRITQDTHTCRSCRSFSFVFFSLVCVCFHFSFLPFCDFIVAPDIRTVACLCSFNIYILFVYLLWCFMSFEVVSVPVFSFK